MKDNTFFRWCIGLFDNSPNGASMRKVIAVWVMILVTRIHNKYLSYQAASENADFSQAQTMLYVDYLMIGLLLGMILFQDIVKLKNGTPVKEEDKKPD